MQQNHTLGRCAAMHAVHLPCHPQPRRIFNTVSAPRRLVSLHRRVLPPILSMDAPTPTVEPAIEQPTTMATASRGLQAPSTTVTKVYWGLGCIGHYIIHTHTHRETHTTRNTHNEKHTHCHTHCHTHHRMSPPRNGLPLNLRLTAMVSSA